MTAKMALRIFLRQVKQSKQRKLSTSAIVLQKSDDKNYIIKSPLQDIVLTQHRFIDRLWLDSANFTNHVAIECAETNKAYTYSQLQKHMATFATSLHKRFGLKQGDVVAAMLPNCPEFPIVAFGTVQAGCVLSTFNPIYKEYEISHQILTTEPKLIVTIPECYDTVVKSLINAKRNAKIILIDNTNTTMPEGATRFSEIAENGDVDHKLLDKIETNLDDTAFIPFSSGTTGLPKGVEISYKNILSALEIMHNKHICFPKLTEGDHQDILPCILPFFHIYGLVVPLMAHLALGCKLITMSRFSASLYLDILKKQDVSLLYVVPPIAILLGKHPDVTKEHFRKVRHIVSGAAPLSDTDIKLILEKGNESLQFHQGFGTTETTAMGTTVYNGAKLKSYSSNGKPTSNAELKFIDPITGENVPVGQTGELCIRSPTVMKGYYKNEKATKESMTEDNFFKTGDVGYYDVDDGLFITDRIKDLIKVKGMQVAPAELESILRSHPSVQDAAVIGVPHVYFGEVPKAVIIMKKGQNASPQELQRFVAEKVATYKKIEQVVFVEDIPKTASGKILRNELKKMYA